MATPRTLLAESCTARRGPVTGSEGAGEDTATGVRGTSTAAPTGVTLTATCTRVAIAGGRPARGYLARVRGEEGEEEDLSATVLMEVSAPDPVQNKTLFIQ